MYIIRGASLRRRGQSEIVHARQKETEMKKDAVAIIIVVVIIAARRRLHPVPQLAAQRAGRRHVPPGGVIEQRQVVTDGGRQPREILLHDDDAWTILPPGVVRKGHGPLGPDDLIGVMIELPGLLEGAIPVRETVHVAAEAVIVPEQRRDYIARQVRINEKGFGIEGNGEFLVNVAVALHGFSQFVRHGASEERTDGGTGGKRTLRGWTPSPWMHLLSILLLGVHPVSNRMPEDPGRVRRAALLHGLHAVLIHLRHDEEVFFGRR
jgi:hypothetical protein